MLYEAGLIALSQRLLIQHRTFYLPDWSSIRFSTGRGLH